ncbi:MAG: heavy metal-associated domain-containing protein [Planctomycetota bacterium]
MRVLPFVAFALAATGLAFVALRASKPDYVAPTLADVEAHKPAPQKLEGPTPEGCKVVTIEVDGMCCTGCTGKLYERLRATPGFVQGAVSFEEGVARVVVSEDADPASFAAALEFDKYVATWKP